MGRFGRNGPHLLIGGISSASYNHLLSLEVCERHILDDAASEDTDLSLPELFG